MRYLISFMLRNTQNTVEPRNSERMEKQRKTSDQRKFSNCQISILSKSNFQNSAKPRNSGQLSIEQAQDEISVRSTLVAQPLVAKGHIISKMYIRSSIHHPTYLQNANDCFRLDTILAFFICPMLTESVNICFYIENFSVQ